ncbi:hypothetical protein XBJ1_2505 [Xenorhabdus bovienii SS-2004]|uniref:Uncharacterized protein n=1 Tax=Xenorhabdus bovienii (strain SS-2004) TaxID=406818 RepID=D3V1T5_XENBS|nr:hypothetical protein XBJ1_2505 [Xenorhabdus bovienii SS-2004]
MRISALIIKCVPTRSNLAADNKNGVPSKVRHFYIRPSICSSQKSITNPPISSQDKGSV